MKSYSFVEGEWKSATPGFGVVIKVNDKGGCKIKEGTGDFEGPSQSLDQEQLKWARIAELEDKMARFYWVIWEGDEDAGTAKGEIEKFAQVENVELNHIIKVGQQNQYGAQTEWIPNDPFYDSEKDYQKYLKDIDASEAWGRSTKKGQGATIAILDSSVDINHNDLKDKVIAGSLHIDPEGNEDGVLIEDPTDENCLHGTICARIAASATDNNLEMAGVCPNCNIIGFRIDSGECGGMNHASIARAVDYARQLGADVISMSFMYVFEDEWEDYSSKVAYERAYEDGIILVAAAGNSGRNQHEYPASYPEVISVAATGDYGIDGMATLAEYSTWNDKVDIASPGCFDYKLKIGEPNLWDFKEQCGTSIAAPIVAGVAGFLKAETNGKINLGQFRELIKTTAGVVGGHNFGSLRFDELMIKIKTLDEDNDRLKFIDEIIYGTLDSTRDFDGDDLSDGEEVLDYHTDPTKKDTDGDGLTDGEEIDMTETDPLKTDTDGDGISDYDEVKDHNNWSDPNDANDPPEQVEGGNGGQPQGEEQQEEIEPEPTEEDSDGDGYDDIYDCYPNDASKWVFPKFSCCQQDNAQYYYVWRESCGEGWTFIPFDPSTSDKSYEDYYDDFPCGWWRCTQQCADLAPDVERWSGTQDASYCRCFRPSINVCCKQGNTGMWHAGACGEEWIQGTHQSCNEITCDMLCESLGQEKNQEWTGTKIDGEHCYCSLVN